MKIGKMKHGIMPQSQLTKLGVIAKTTTLHSHICLNS